MSANNDYEYPLIEPAGTFQFECKQCGECCRNVREAICLESLDLFRLARFMKQEISEFVSQYTEMRLLVLGYPILILKTRQHMDSCIFLKSGKCSVHSAKPRTCRMYPLSANSENGKLLYFVVSKKQHHFTGRTHRADEWMDQCLNAEDREFMMLEENFAKEFGKILHHIDPAFLDTVTKKVLLYKYLFYDVSFDFLKQYVRNMAILKQELIRLADKKP